jgi:hypothetical protein
MIGTPNADAARPAVAAPPGWNDSSEPTGARITGNRSLRPNRVVPRSTFETSTQTRGRSASESIASRFRRRVVSVSVAPTR